MKVMKVKTEYGIVMVAKYGRQSTAKVISAWPFKSSSGTTTYETQLHEDGVLTCSCPGWVNRAVRECRHVKEKLYEASEIVSGRRNPVFQQDTYAPSWENTKNPTIPRVGAGRLIERENPE